LLPTEGKACIVGNSKACTAPVTSGLPDGGSPGRAEAIAVVTAGCVPVRDPPFVPRIAAQGQRRALTAGPAAHPRACEVSVGALAMCCCLGSGSQKCPRESGDADLRSQAAAAPHPSRREFLIRWPRLNADAPLVLNVCEQIELGSHLEPSSHLK